MLRFPDFKMYKNLSLVEIYHIFSLNVVTSIEEVDSYFCFSTHLWELNKWKQTVDMDYNNWLSHCAKKYSISSKQQEHVFDKS